MLWQSQPMGENETGRVLFQNHETWSKCVLSNSIFLFLCPGIFSPSFPLWKIVHFVPQNSLYCFFFFFLFNSHCVSLSYFFCHFPLWFFNLSFMLFLVSFCLSFRLSFSHLFILVLRPHKVQADHERDQKREIKMKLDRFKTGFKISTRTGL